VLDASTNSSRWDDDLCGRFNRFPDNEPLVFYGSFQIAELIAANKPSWKPGPLKEQFGVDSPFLSAPSLLPNRSPVKS
jgi:hypothetical protein